MRSTMFFLTHDDAASGTGQHSADRSGGDIERHEQRAAAAREMPARLPEIGRDISDPFALFIKGRDLLGRKRGRSGGEPCAAEMLEHRASALMLLGRDLESAALNEQIIRRFERQARSRDYVSRAHFNAGCAYIRIGMIDKGMEHFRTLIARIEATGNDPLLALAREGVRQGERSLARMRRHRQRVHGSAPPEPRG